MYSLYSSSQRRIVLLDELRGLCLVLMIIYHGLYNLTFMFGVPIPFFSAPLNALQLFICCSFITLAGISCRFSRSNLKRGLLVLGIAVVMTVATWYLDYSGILTGQVVTFGVLHLLGSCMILYGLMNPGGKVEKSSAFVGLLVCLTLFALTWGLPRGYIGLFAYEIVRLPSQLYSQTFTFVIGLPHTGFRSADYFPLLPWAFLFFAGTYLGVAFRGSNLPHFFYRPRIKILSKIGRRTLIVYVLHQPVLYGVMYGVFYIMDLIKG